MNDKSLDKLLEVADDVAREQGTTRKDLLDNLSKKVKEVRNICKASPGKYRIVMIDRFDNQESIYSEKDDRDAAVSEAKYLTEDGKRYTDDSSMATVFYAYDDQGNYLGGDTWNEE